MVSSLVAGLVAAAVVTSAGRTAHAEAHTAYMVSPAGLPAAIVTIAVTATIPVGEHTQHREVVPERNRLIYLPSVVVASTIIVPVTRARTFIAAGKQVPD